jgi:hypothetical protein
MTFCRSVRSVFGMFQPVFRRLATCMTPCVCLNLDPSEGRQEKRYYLEAKTFKTPYSPDLEWARFARIGVGPGRSTRSGPGSPDSEWGESCTPRSPGGAGGWSGHGYMRCADLVRDWQVAPVLSSREIKDQIYMDHYDENPDM